VIPYASELVHLEAEDPPTIEVELGDGAALHGYLRDQAGQAVSDRIRSLLPVDFQIVTTGDPGSTTETLLTQRER